jgi:ribosome-associated translation inhibitor RaiA
MQFSILNYLFVELNLRRYAWSAGNGGGHDMKVHARSVNLRLDTRTRAEVEQRVHAVIGRLARHVRRVEVRVTDRNGPRGGKDIACALEVRLRPRGKIFVEETDFDLATSVNRAAETAATTVVRTLEKARDTRRQKDVNPALGASGA